MNKRDPRGLLRRLGERAFRDCRRPEQTQIRRIPCHAALSTILIPSCSPLVITSAAGGHLRG